MPLHFPVFDERHHMVLSPDGSPLLEPYWSVLDVSKLLHVRASTVREGCRAGLWETYSPPGVRGRYYMNAAMVGQARRVLTQSDDTDPWLPMDGPYGLVAQDPDEAEEAEG